MDCTFENDNFFRFREQDESRKFVEIDSGKFEFFVGLVDVLRRELDDENQILFGVVVDRLKMSQHFLAQAIVFVVCCKNKKNLPFVVVIVAGVLVFDYVLVVRIMYKITIERQGGVFFAPTTMLRLQRHILLSTFVTAYNSILKHYF